VASSAVNKSLSFTHRVPWRGAAWMRSRSTSAVITMIGTCLERDRRASLPCIKGRLDQAHSVSVW
jgi:hypothetical protein